MAATPRPTVIGLDSQAIATLVQSSVLMLLSPIVRSAFAGLGFVGFSAIWQYTLGGPPADAELSLLFMSTFFGGITVASFCATMQLTIMATDAMTGSRKLRAFIDNFWPAQVAGYGDILGGVLQSCRALPKGARMICQLVSAFAQLAVGYAVVGCVGNDVCTRVVAVHPLRAVTTVALGFVAAELMVRGLVHAYKLLLEGVLDMQSFEHDGKTEGTLSC